MGRIFVVVSLPAAVAALGLAGGCSSNSAGGADASIDGPGIIVGGGDSSAGDGHVDGGGAVGTTMRLAHASSDLGPIDFCWRSTGTASFTGPVLAGAVKPVDAGSAGDAEMDAGDAEPDGGVPADAGTEATGDAGPQDGAPYDAWDDAGATDAAQTPEAAPPPGALVFGGMTPDVNLMMAGTFDIALVPAGSTSCLRPLLVDQVTLDAGKRATVVVMGRVGYDAGPSALALAAFIDAPADPLSARVRFIHAALGSPGESPAPPLSVHANATLVAAEVDPGKAATASTSPPVDSLGYATLAQPIAGTATVSLTATGDAGKTTQWTTPSTSLDLGLGSAHTGIVVSLAQGALGVAWCGDVDDSGGRTACTLITALP